MCTHSHTHKYLHTLVYASLPQKEIGAIDEELIIKQTEGEHGEHHASLNFALTYIQADVIIPGL